MITITTYTDGRKTVEDWHDSCVCYLEGKVAQYLPSLEAGLAWANFDPQRLVVSQTVKSDVPAGLLTLPQGLTVCPIYFAGEPVLPQRWGIHIEDTAENLMFLSLSGEILYPVASLPKQRLAEAMLYLEQHQHPITVPQYVWQAMESLPIQEIWSGFYGCS